MGGLPSGGIDKISPFVRLFHGNKVNLAALSDIGNGDFTKIELLKKSQILKAGRFFTVADFVEQKEADIEDLFERSLFVDILNGAYSPPESHVVTIESLQQADPKTSRSVKQAEVLFRSMPEDVSEFDHFGPARWLMKNPQILDADTPAIIATLDRAEKVFQTYNRMLD